MTEKHAANNDEIRDSKSTENLELKATTYDAKRGGSFESAHTNSDFTTTWAGQQVTIAYDKVAQELVFKVMV